MAKNELKIKEIQGDNNCLAIYWVITNYCNFSCSYCPPYLHSGSDVPNQPSREILIEFCNKLNELADTNLKIDLDIAGGEPTTHQNIKEILGRLNSKIYVGIITNGSRPINWWKDFKKLPDKVAFSIHSQSNIPKIIEIADFLMSKMVYVVFNCSMDAENWDDSIAKFEFFKAKYGWRAGPKIINSLKNGIQYAPQELTLEQKKYIISPNIKNIDPDPNHTTYVMAIKEKKSSANGRVILQDNSIVEDDVYKLRQFLVRNDLNHFYGWQCNAGINMISIMPNGDIMAGICKISKIGHINNFQINKHSIICNKNTCCCPADVLVSKKLLSNK